MNKSYICLIFCVLSAYSAAADTLYVDASATGSNNGSFWEDAFVSLRVALLNSEYGDQVWVAEGTYTPITGINRLSSFGIQNGTQVFGGFQAGDTSLLQRDWKNNLTIMSGDIGIPGDSTDNSYTVVRITGADSTTVLDGFIIEGGAANEDPGTAGSEFFYNGAGAYITGHSSIPESRPHIRNCTFRHNFASGSGGGVYLESEPGKWCSFIFENCVFEQNAANNGGGVAVLGGSNEEDSRFLECEFTENISGRVGGGVAFFNSIGTQNLTFEKCNFKDNFCVLDGAGFYAEKLDASIDSVKFNKCIFESNWGGDNSSGGAIACFDLTLLNIAILLIEDCRFIENSAGLGGAFALFAGKIIARNCLIYDLKSEGNGGVIVGGSGINNYSTFFTNCTFYKFSDSNGSFSQSGTHHLYNCILIEDRPDSIPPTPIASGGSLTLSHCLLDVANCNGINSSADCGPGMIFGADPLFVNPDSGDFRLRPCSPARDAGSNAWLSASDTLDLDGLPRITGDSVDMGAYETRAFAASIPDLQPVNCRGDSSGLAHIDLQSACLPLAVQFEGNVFSVDSSGFSLPDLPAGQYELILADAQGRTDTLSFEIEEPAEQIAVEVSTTQVSCEDGIAGTATAQGTNGMPPFTYLWSDGLPDAPSQDSLPAGDYTLTLRDSLGCEASTAFSITTKGKLELSADTIPISCFDSADGALEVSSLNGTAPFQWQWQNGEDSALLDSLGPGLYAVTVSDALHCRDTLTLTLQAPDTLQVAFEKPDTVCFGVQNLSISATGLGGTPPYTYLWSDGQTDSVGTGLDAGPHQLTLTDANGCAQQASVSVAEYPAIELTDTVITSATGAGQSDGAISIGGITGGVPPYIYLWSNGESTLSLTDLPPGLYTLTVSDSLDCWREFTFELDYVVSTLEQAGEPGISLFPNPASEYIILELSRETAHQAQAVELYDSSGKRVWREALSAQLRGVRIPLARLAQGVYGCRVVLEGGEALNGRFVVGRGE